MTEKQLKLFKENYEVQFDQALTGGDKEKAHQILENCRKDYDQIQSNNKRRRTISKFS